MNAGWLACALGIVVVAIAGYTAFVLQRESKLQRRIDELEGAARRRV